MTATTVRNIYNLETLQAEKERLKNNCRNMENHMEERLDYLNTHKVNLAVDYVLIPALRKTFSVQNLLNLLNLGSLSTLYPEADKKDNKILGGLTGLFSKTGWLIAVKAALTIAQKLLK